MRHLFLTLFLLVFTQLLAQNDSVILVTEAFKLVPRYRIIYPVEKGKCIQETFAFVKERIFLVSTDTNDLSLLISEYSKPRRKYPNVSLLWLEECNPAINEIRNGSFNSKNHSEFDPVELILIGDNNQAFRDFQITQRMFIESLIKEKCYAEFIESTRLVNGKMLTFIDSVYAEKVRTLEFVSANVKTIDQSLVDRFMKSFSSCDADWKTMELIVIHQPEMFMSAVYRIPDSQWSTKDFSAEVDRKAMYIALEQTKDRSPQKRSILASLKYTFTRLAKQLGHES